MNYLALIVKYWKVVLLGALLAALGTQTWRLHAEQNEFEEFRIETAATAKAAQAAADAQAAHYELLLEEADHDYKEREARLKRLHSAALRGMLDSVASRDFVPAAPGAPASGAGDVACYHRGELNASLTGSLQQFAAELTTIAGVGEGLAAAVVACATAWPGSERPGAVPPSAPRGDDVDAAAVPLSR